MNLEIEKLARRIKEIKPEAKLGKDSDEDVKWLRGMKVPEDILEFFANFEPKEEIDIEGVKLNSVSEIKLENTEYIPGYVICKYGYVVIASTICGDIFAVKVRDTTDSAVYLMSHDEIHEDSSLEEVNSKRILVAKNFQEFLQKFVKKQLPYDWYYAKRYGIRPKHF